MQLNSSQNPMWMDSSSVVLHLRTLSKRLFELATNTEIEYIISRRDTFVGLFKTKMRCIVSIDASFL